MLCPGNAQATFMYVHPDQGMLAYAQQVMLCSAGHATLKLCTGYVGLSSGYAQIMLKVCQIKLRVCSDYAADMLILC